MPYELIWLTYGINTAKIRLKYGYYGSYPGVFREYSKDIQGDNDLCFPKNVVNFESKPDFVFSPCVKLQQK